ncbi:MAG: hypothetical protein A2216_00160 [Omnitrophica WOR_2 bacterium RIFOXYA2_FULL_45_12]|nr:MAG: hypothetical protein A2216_00160 [Omnitrophica WOR_2 bacterium RIFOXYA2_FULL_45_12]
MVNPPIVFCLELSISDSLFGRDTFLAITTLYYYIYDKFSSKIATKIKNAFKFRYLCYIYK